MDNQFRNAAFGGFNRQDVMEYLERTAKEHSQVVEQLRTQLEQTQKERGELIAQLEQAKEELQALTRARESALREAEQAREECTAAQQQVREQESCLAQAEAVKEQLLNRVALLEPDAAAYAAVKERTAGVELEAHRRAQGVIDQARDEAAQMRQQMEQWLGRVSREYGELRTQVDATVAHAAGELEKVRLSLDGISQCMDRQEGILDGLFRAYEEQDPGKVPAPMPLSE